MSVIKINPNVISKPSIPVYKEIRPDIIYKEIEPIYRGETIYLIGGGPSLKGFDFNLLKDKKTIAINKAYTVAPFANFLYWSDYRFYQLFKEDIDNFKGYKVTNKPKPVIDSIINLKDTGKLGLDIHPHALRNGNNSGYAAINLAVHLGAKKIILLGYDMGSSGKDTHFHSGYDTRTEEKIYKNNMIPCFDSIVDELKELNIEIWNSSKDSKLTCFPKCSLTEVLNF
jgi:hypothetical protein